MESKACGRTLGVLIAVIILLGCAARLFQLGAHVTYVDEMIVLAEGNWNVAGREKELGSHGPLEFARKIALNSESSYAPLQFLFTYFAVGDDPLTPGGLHRSRLVSAVIGCLSLPLLLLCAWRATQGRLGWAILTPIVLLSLSHMNILNARQNHSYIAGVTSVLVALFCFDRARLARGWPRRTLYLTIPGLLPLANYQVLFANVGIGAIVAGFHITHWWHAERRARELIHSALAFVPLAVMTLSTMVVLARLKSDLSIAWWVAPFGVGDGAIQSMLKLPRLFFDIFHALTLTSPTRALGNVTALIVCLGLLAGCGLFVTKKHRSSDGGAFHFLSTLAVLAVFTTAYLCGRIPLSPSRHSLILTPLVLLSIYHVLRELETRLSGTAAATILRAGYIACTVALAGAFLADYPKLLDRSRETFDAGDVRRLAAQSGTDLVVAGHWDYNKAYCFLKGDIDEGRLRLMSVTHQREFPAERFILLGQNPEIFRSIYTLTENSSYTSRLLLSTVKAYDFEPSLYVRYWSNHSLAWLVEPRREIKLAPPTGE